jgi:hypothetical protein
MPILAQASVQRRAAIDLSIVREAVRRLFELLHDETARGQFLAQVAVEVAEPVRDEIERQRGQRNNAYSYWLERGGLDAVAAAESQKIVNRYGRWLTEGLEPWMVSIYPVLNEDVWVGARDDPGGVVDMLLLADAIGLQAYNWNLDMNRSLFHRLDLVAASDPGLVVLGECYSSLAYA